MWRFGLLLVVTIIQANGSENTGESGEGDFGGDYNVTRNYGEPKYEDESYDNSGEQIGAAVTQVTRHPYAASLLRNDSYECSAVILNTYWLLAMSKCFDSKIITSYVTHRYLGNYTIRTGSSYNIKGGSISQIKMLINHFDLKVSAVKLLKPLQFSSNVGAVRLPSPDEDVSMGFLATMLAWTPTGHIRIVNAPIISATICEPSTNLQPGRYICLGGVQDPNRHFCRRDNGGAVIQNNTLVAISSFLHTCALYTKTHAFPKVSTFSRWLDTVIWDENNRPTTTGVSLTTSTTQIATNTSETSDNLILDDRNYLVTLPFDPINVPLEPAEDNSVIPRMSLYESYLQNMAKAKTSTTIDPNVLEEKKKEWLQKFGKSILRMPPQMLKKYQQLEYN